jgi:hypothetical protein
MAARRCTVSYTDSSGIRHQVTVDAGSVNEACCLALIAFKASRAEGSGWGEPPGTATEFVVEVIPRPVIHSARLTDVMRWLESGSADPASAVEKVRLKKLLAAGNDSPPQSARRR